MSGPDSAALVDALRRLSTLLLLTAEAADNIVAALSGDEADSVRPVLSVVRPSFPAADVGYGLAEAAVMLRVSEAWLAGQPGGEVFDGPAGPVRLFTAADLADIIAANEHVPDPVRTGQRTDTRPDNARPVLTLITSPTRDGSEAS